MTERSIMVIDDSPVDRKMMKKIIEKGLDQVSVRECDNASNIFEQIEFYKLKVIILDLVLKNESGLEVLRRLKENFLTSDIPVIIFSSINDPEVIKEALSLGAYDYFEKPLTVNDIAFALSLKVNNALELKLSIDRMNYLRNHDVMTGLYTRVYMEAYFSKIGHENEKIALVILDINGLKVINDVYGYSVGDKILKSVGSKLQEKCDDCLCISRWGSDEFAILIHKNDKEALESYIDDLIEELYSAHETKFEISYGYKLDNVSSHNIYDLIRETEDHLSSNKVIASSSFKNNMIKTIINTLHQKNNREELHSKRVSEIAKKIAEEMSFSSYEVKKIEVAGLMHDIGKIAIDESILNKEGKLTNAEWHSMQRHPEIGFRILSTSSDTLDIANAVLGHHERWDGKGYPQKLKGHDIPLMARIICVADAFDAMTGYRTYRDSVESSEALNEVIACSGTQFDPDVVEVFIKIMKDVI